MIAYEKAKKEQLAAEAAKKANKCKPQCDSESDQAAEVPSSPA